MRPIRLDLHGFAAFREPACVDFTGAEYFALVGPTGSGKSTVIDAMTFALYGSVPRWDDQRTVRLALSPSATRGAVRLVFEVGEQRYVAARELRRAASGSVTVRNARLERLVDGADPDGDTEALAADSEVTKAVEELLGLPFDQFCVCVVLPQGDFAQFLHARPAERQRVLERILGFGMYRDILQRAGAEASGHRQKADLLTEQLGRYADATPDAVAAAERRVADLAALVDRVAEQGPALAVADERVAEARRDADRAGEQARLLAAVRAPDGLAALAERARSAAARVAEARAALTAAEQADTSARDTLDAAPDPEPLRQARRDHAELARLGPALPGLAEVVAAAEREVAAARERAAAAEGQAEAARAERERAGTARDALAEEAERLTAERDRLAAVRVPPGVDRAGGRHREAAEALTAARRAQAEAEDADHAARAAIAAAGEAVAAARAHHDAMARADQAAALRAHLVAGEACPVCEQAVATVPPAVGGSALPAARDALRRAEQAQRERTTAAERAAAEARRARRTTADAEQVVAEAARAMDAAGAALRDTRDPLVALGAPALTDDPAASWAGLAGWAANAAAERSARLAGLDLAAADHAVARAGAAAREAADVVERQRRAEQAALRAEQEARGAEQRARDRHTELTKALAAAPTAAEAEAALAERDRLADRARAAHAALRTARAGLSGANEGAARVADDLRRGWRGLAAARDPLVGLGAPARAEDAGDGADDLVAAWRELTGWAAAGATERARARAAAEAAHTDAGSARERLHAAVRADLAALDVTPAPGRPLTEAAPVAVASALERVRGAATRLAERRAEAARLLADRDRAEEAQQVATMLARLMRSERFPRWLVASALDTLVADASRRLAELSGGQFALTHADGEFQVVDHADADLSRPVKTLSGGETFQASLALALALSDQLATLAAAGAARLDSIFLDEGFGTLDAANLEVVASTLENLASLGDRMVGVVTHVPALAERVPVRFVVSRDQRTSSIQREDR